VPGAANHRFCKEKRVEALTYAKHGAIVDYRLLTLGRRQHMSRKVLLIEDEPNIVEAMRFLMQREGWNVLAHDNGADALDVIAREDPDLVVLDVMLPGMSGFDILNALRAEDETAGLPVLMLTARGQSRDRDLAEKAGVSRFMTKPFSNTEVLTAVRDLLHLHAQPRT
jgi:DNA-binding response OmpR family regulator